MHASGWRACGAKLASKAFHLELRIVRNFADNVGVCRETIKPNPGFPTLIAPGRVIKVAIAIVLWPKKTYELS